MRRFHGVGASHGIAIGPAYPLEVSVQVSERKISGEEIEPEIARFDDAVATTAEQLLVLQRDLEGQGGEGAELVEVQLLMLKSGKLAGETRRRIREEAVGAEWALRLALDRIRATFLRITERRFRERGADVEAVGERLLRTLLGMPELRPDAGAPRGAIAVGVDLSPLDPLALARAGVGGIASDGGGRTSHTAILARALGLPYVVAVKGLSVSVHPGDTLIVDGGCGDVIINPDPDTRRAFEARAAVARARAEHLEAARSLPAVTLDGCTVTLNANVESLSEIAAVIDAGATSVGLFRTEFLYLERSDLPNEEEQYVDAVAVLEALGGRVVTFRTLDLGGDKLALSLRPPKGPNPALGVRSIRFSLQRPDIFRTQLRALYRAAALGPVRIIFPLVSGVTEMIRARALCRAVCEELAAAGVAHRPDIPIGAMIETPSAAMTVDHLAQACDFFSIGTNDLIQYAFAADRENEEVNHLSHPLHPAVLRSIKQVLDAASLADKPVSLCGDMAGDPALTWILVGLGLTDLSMAPRQIPAVKAVIRASSLAEMRDLASQALSLRSEVEVQALVTGIMHARFGAELGDLLEGPTADSTDLAAWLPRGSAADGPTR
jgi:phosphoenolpyruvate-protein phosphotransferase (PTS system enzyme I)